MTEEPLIVVPDEVFEDVEKSLEIIEKAVNKLSAAQMEKVGFFLSGKIFFLAAPEF